MPRAEPEQPAGVAEGGLRRLLEQARLVKYHQALVDLGAESVIDLEDVTTDQLQRIGMRELEIDRLRKATNGGTLRRQGSLLVKPRGTAYSGSHGGDLNNEQLLPSGGGRSSVSDFAQLQQRTENPKWQKKCCCCTRKQLLIALGTILTSVIAGVASVLVKHYMEQKVHKDAPICISAIERCAHSKCRCAFPRASPPPARQAPLFGGVDCQLMAAMSICGAARVLSLCARSAMTGSTFSATTRMQPDAFRTRRRWLLRAMTRTHTGCTHSNYRASSPAT